MIGKSCDFGEFFLFDVSSIQIGKKYVVRKKNCRSHARYYIESRNSIVYHVCQSVRPSIGWSVGLVVSSHHLRLELLPNCPYPCPIRCVISGDVNDVVSTSGYVCKVTIYLLKKTLHDALRCLQPSLWVK